MRGLPEITKNLLLVNILFFLLTSVCEKFGIDLLTACGLHYIKSDSFNWWQPLTYLFLHANFGHLFCNMFALFFFGPTLESNWGGRRFLIYYLVCGIGAGIIQETVWALHIAHLAQTYSMESIIMNYANMVVTIGASGAIFGLLFAIAWLFPSVPLFFLFVPIPIRARVFVIFYAIFELLAGLAPGAGDNVAHFAHLGGLVFGWILMLFWGERKRTMGPGLWDWLMDKWKNFVHNITHNRKDDDDDDRGRDFSDYHYQKPL